MHAQPTRRNPRYILPASVPYPLFFPASARPARVARLPVRGFRKPRRTFQRKCRKYSVRAPRGDRMRNASDQLRNGRRAAYPIRRTRPAGTTDNPVRGLTGRFASPSGARYGGQAGVMAEAAGNRGRRLNGHVCRFGWPRCCRKGQVIVLPALNATVRNAPYARHTLSPRRTRSVDLQASLRRALMPNGASEFKPGKDGR